MTLRDDNPPSSLWKHPSEFHSPWSRSEQTEFLWGHQGFTVWWILATCFILFQAAVETCLKAHVNYFHLINWHPSGSGLKPNLITIELSVSLSATLSPCSSSHCHSSGWGLQRERFSGVPELWGCGRAHTCPHLEEGEFLLSFNNFLKWVDVCVQVSPQIFNKHHVYSQNYMNLQTGRRLHPDSPSVFLPQSASCFLLLLVKTKSQMSLESLKRFRSRNKQLIDLMWLKYEEHILNSNATLFVYITLCFISYRLTTPSFLH